MAIEKEKNTTEQKSQPAEVKVKDENDKELNDVQLEDVSGAGMLPPNLAQIGETEKNL